MKRIFFVITLIAIFTLSMAQTNDFITIGSGDSTSPLAPISTAFAYSYVQVIYLQEEIGTARPITKLSFDYHGITGANSNSQWNIYLGYTAISSFNMPQDFVPLEQLTAVFSGTVTLPASRTWIEIVLDSPFLYNGLQNLVIAVNEVSTGSNGGVFSITNTDSARSIRVISANMLLNPAFPANFMGLTLNRETFIPNIRLTMPASSDDAYFGIIPSEKHFGNVSIAQKPFENFVVSNFGNSPLTISDIDISGSNANEFEYTLETGLTLPKTINFGESFVIKVTLNPQSMGEKTATLQITDAITRRSINSIPLSATVQDNAVIQIGYGTLEVIGTNNMNALPVMNFFSGDTFSQQIYLNEEIGIYSLQFITDLAFHYSNLGGVTISDNMRHWDVYIGHTTADAFDTVSSWIPLNDHTLVFSGLTPQYQQNQWLQLQLDNQFVYNGTDNIVVSVHRRRPANTSNTYVTSRFYMTHTPGVNRSLSFGHSNYALDTPPSQDGTFTEGFPNIRFSFDNIFDEAIFSISPITGDFQVQELYSPSEPISYVISNKGLQDLYITSIAIIGEDANHFNILNFPNLSNPVVISEAPMIFDIVFEPTSIGYKEAFLEVLPATQTTPFIIPLTGEGVVRQIIQIGYGNGYGWTAPIQAGAAYSYTQFIYYQHEINIANSKISRISFWFKGLGHSTHGVSSMNNWDIYFAHTDRIDFPGTGGYPANTVSDYIPQSEFTKVFSGIVPMQLGVEEWIEITLDTPFEYNNIDNLVIAVNRIGIPGGGGSGGIFDMTPSQPAYRTMYSVSSNNVFDVDNMQNWDVWEIGNRNSDMPNILIEFQPLSEDPIFSVSPVKVEFGNVLNDEPVYPTRQVIVTNGGENPLTISEITIQGFDENYFSVKNLNELNLPRQVGYGGQLIINVEFAFDTLGDKTANLIITEAITGRTINIVPLSGTLLDPTIRIFPNLEGFDESRNLPQAWRSIMTPTANSPVVEIVAGESWNPSNTPPNHFRLYNGGNNNINTDFFMFYTPPIENIQEKFVSFWARSGSNNSQLIIGTLNSVGNTESFTNIETISLTNTYQQYFVILEEAEAPYIAFRHGMNFTWNDIFIDTIEIVHFNDLPVFSVVPTNHSFSSNLFTPSVQTFTIRNIGADGLVIADVRILGGDNQLFYTIDFEPSQPLLSLETYDIKIGYAPYEPELKQSSAVILNENGAVIGRIPLSGTGIDNSISVFPAVATFNWSIPTGWLRYEGILPETDNAVLTQVTTGWNTAMDHTVLNLAGSNVRHWLVTPLYNLTDISGGKTLEFDLALANASGELNLTGTDDRFIVLASTDGGLTWNSENIILEYDDVYEIPNILTKVFVDMSQFNSYVRLAFYGESTVDNANNQLRFGNFKLWETPTEPVFVINPSVAQNFGSVTIPNVSSERSFTITNAGGDLLLINSIEIVGEDFSEFVLNLPGGLDLYGTHLFVPNSVGINTEQERINAFRTGINGINTEQERINAFPAIEYNGTPYIFTVQFAPSTPGAKTAILRINHSDGTEFDINLSGTAPVTSITELPFIELFSATTMPPPGGWTRHSGNLPETGNATLGANNTGNWERQSTFAGTIESGGGASIELYSSNHGWLITPEIHFNTDDVSLVLDFDIALTQYSTSNNNTPTNRNGNFIVLASTDNTWSRNHIIAEWENSPSAARYYGNIPNRSESITIELENLTSPFRIAFYARAVSSDNRVHIDNVAVRAKEIPTITTFPWTENFNSPYFPPHGWDRFTNSSLGFNWNRLYYSSTSVGNYGATSESWRQIVGGNITPDNWLITPNIAVPNNTDEKVVLSYSVSTNSVSNPMEYYTVYISTTGKQETDFVQVFTEALTITDLTWAQRSVDLTDYLGENIYVAFRHHNQTGGGRLRLDDVSIMYEILPPVLTATAEFGVIQLSWIVPGSQTPDRYYLYRNGSIWISFLGDTNSYTDNDVYYEEVYTYYITAVYGNAESPASNLITIAPVSDILYPVNNLTATVNDNVPTLNWEAPNSSWLTHAQTDTGRGVGFGVPATMQVAHRFTPAILEGFGVVGKEISKIALVGNHNIATFTIRVWTGGSFQNYQFNQGTLVRDQYVGTLEPMVWHEIELETPIVIPSGQELWFGYEVVTPGEGPMVIDNGQTIYDFGNIIQINDEFGIEPWDAIDYYGIYGNWLIKAYVENDDEVTILSNNDMKKPFEIVETEIVERNRITPTRNSQRIDYTNNNRYGVVTGFNIYRDDVLIQTNPIHITTFTDTMRNVDAYNYSVTAIYNNKESEARDILVRVGLNPPTSLSSVNSSGTAILAWLPPVSPGATFLNYMIYRDGVLLTTQTGSTTYQDIGLLNEVNYTYHVTAVYSTSLGNIESVLSEPCNVYIEGDILYPPRNLQLTNNFSQVTLSWDSSGMQEGNFTLAQTETWGTAIGAQTAPFTYSAYHRYTARQLVDMGLAGTRLTEVGFLTNSSNAMYTIRIWTGGSDSPLTPGTMIHEQPVTGAITIREWHDVTLDEVVIIPHNTELWFGVEVTMLDTTSAIIIDQGPMINRFGNITYQTTGWSTLFDLNTSLPYNWMIRGFAEAYYGPSVVGKVLDSDISVQQISARNINSDIISSAVNRTNRYLTGYRIYRNNVLRSETEFLSYHDEVQNTGTYSYSVSSVYSDGGESTAVRVFTSIQSLDLQVSEFPFTEGFDERLLSGWRNRDLDADEQSWIVLLDANSAYEGDGYVVSFGMPTTNNWLISPRIDLQEAPIAYAYYLNYVVASAPAGMLYEVLISTTGTAVNDFELLFSDTVNNLFWEEVSIVIPKEYENENIYLAFRHVGNQNMGLLRLDEVWLGIDFIDPIFVISPEEHDFGLVEIETTVTKDFIITNESLIPIVIESITIDTPTFQLQNLPLFPIEVDFDTELIFNVVFTPLTDGFHNANIIIITNEENMQYTASLHAQVYAEIIENLPYIMDFTQGTPPNWEQYTMQDGELVLIPNPDWQQGDNWVIGDFNSETTAQASTSGNNRNLYLITPPIEYIYSDDANFIITLDLAFTGNATSSPTFGSQDDTFEIQLIENADTRAENIKTLLRYDNSGLYNSLDGISRTCEPVLINIANYPDITNYEGKFQLAFYMHSTIMDTDNIVHVANIVIDQYDVNAVRNFSYSIVDEAIKLEWEAPEEQVLGTLEGYRLFRDSIFIELIDHSQTSYIDSDAQIDTRYSYSIEAVYTSPTLTSKPLTIQAVIPIFSPINNLTYQFTDDVDVILSWLIPDPQNVGDVIGYNVYKNDELQNIDFIIETTYIDYNPGDDVIHEYKVTAIYFFDDEMHDYKESITQDISMLVPRYGLPVNFIGNPLNARNRLNWQPPLTQEFGNVTAYNIYKYNAGNTEIDVDQIDITSFVLHDTTTDLTYLDNNLINGNFYAYYITAIWSGDIQGESKPTDRIMLNPLDIPYPPTDVILTLHTENSVNITWTAPESETPVRNAFIRSSSAEISQYRDNIHVLGYNIYRNETKINVELIPNNITEFIDEFLQTDNLYSYGITAVYLTTESEPAQNQIILPSPNPPRNLQAISGLDAMVRLVWQAPISPVYGTLNSYKVYRDGEFLHEINDTAAVQYVDSGLDNTIEYQYYITATYIGDIQAESVPSNLVTAVPEDYIKRPDSISASLTDNNYVELSWTPIDSVRNAFIRSDLSMGSHSEQERINAFPTDWEEGRAFIGYMLYRNDLPITETPINVTEYLDINTTLDTEYKYGVTAVYSSGESLPTETTIIVPIFNPVTNIHATANPNIGQITVTWTPPQTQNHGALTGYNIYRNQTVIDIVPANTNSFNDTNVTFYTEYIYNVTALYARPDGVSQTANNFNITMLENILPPTDLEHEFIAFNNVLLKWNAPETIYIDFYIQRNNVTIVENVTDVFYIDKELPQGLYHYHVYAKYIAGESEPAYLLVDVVVENNDIVIIPEITELLQNYPNPFNPITNIGFNLANDEHVVIEIYNIRGQKVITLVDNYMNAGVHNVTWNGKDEFGRDVTSGMYLYTMKSGKYSQIRRMMLMK